MNSYKVLREEVTEYWKITSDINAEVVGGSYDANTLKYTVPSGERGHLLLPGVAPLSTADYWEIAADFDYQGGGSYPCVFGYSGGSDCKAPTLLVENGVFKLFLSSTGNGWNILSGASTGVQANVGSRYKFNVRFTGVAYVVRCSVNGGEFTEVLRHTSSTPVHCSVPFWFMNLGLNNNYPMNGSMRMGGAWIFIDNDYWWQGTKEEKVPATPEDYDIVTTEIQHKVATDTETAYWKEGTELNATMSGGSYNQDTGVYTVLSGGRGHIQLPEVAPLSTANSWEIKTKFTYQGGGNAPCLFGYSGGSDYATPVLIHEGGSYKFGVSYLRGWNIWGDTRIVPQVGTTYYFKAGFTGSEYYVDYRTAGQENYTRAFSQASTSKAFCIAPFWFMDLSLNSNYPTYGDLDLTETSITIDGIEWWKGTKGSKPVVHPNMYWKYTNIADGYRLLDSIKGNGTQALDTGVYPKDTTKVQSKFIYSNYSGGIFIGSQGNGEADSFRLFRHQSTTYLDYGSGDGHNRISGTYLASTGDAYEMEFGNRYVKDIPTNTVKFSSSSVSFAQKNFTIQLTSQDDYGTFYYVKIFDGDTLVRDLIPCERVADGMVGMWDNVTNSFIEPSASFIKGDYVLIEGTPDDYDIIQPNWDFTTESHIYKALKVAEPKVYPRTMEQDETGIYSLSSSREQNFSCDSGSVWGYFQQHGDTWNLDYFTNGYYTMPYSIGQLIAIKHTSSSFAGGKPTGRVYTNAMCLGYLQDNVFIPVVVPHFNSSSYCNVANSPAVSLTSSSNPSGSKTYITMNRENNQGSLTYDYFGIIPADIEGYLRFVCGGYQHSNRLYFSAGEGVTGAAGEMLNKIDTLLLIPKDEYSNGAVGWNGQGNDYKFSRDIIKLVDGVDPRSLNVSDAQFENAVNKFGIV